MHWPRKFPVGSCCIAFASSLCLRQTTALEMFHYISLSLFRLFQSRGRTSEWVLYCSSHIKYYCSSKQNIFTAFKHSTYNVFVTFLIRSVVYFFLTPVAFYVAPFKISVIHHHPKNPNITSQINLLCVLSDDSNYSLFNSRIPNSQIVLPT